MNADPDPAFQMNADPDPAFQMNADPCESGSGIYRYVKNKKFCQSLKIMLNFNENKVTINIFTPITLIFILFMPTR
jgi:hypothetical protein